MVETARLKIVPLDESQLLQYLRANDMLEKELGLVSTGRVMNPDVKKMVERFTLPKMMNAPHDHFLYYTFWIVIDKSTNSIVAELGFKGPPGSHGDVEIGYGTMPDQQNKGYMTEAVSGMLDWANQRSEIKKVLAETSRMNAASIRVVENNGFEQFDQKGEMLWWVKWVG